MSRCSWFFVKTWLVVQCLYSKICVANCVGWMCSFKGWLSSVLLFGWQTWGVLLVGCLEVLGRPGSAGSLQPVGILARLIFLGDAGKATLATWCCWKIAWRFLFFFFGGGGKWWWQLVFRGRKKFFGVFSVPYLEQGTHTHTTVRISERTAVVGWLCLSIYERLIWNTCFSCLFWVKRLHFYHYNRFHVLWCSMRIWQSVFIIYIVNSAGFLDPCHLSCKNTNHIRDLNLVKGAIISAAGMVGNDRNWSHLPEATLIAGCSIPQFLERTWWVLCHWSGTNKYLNSRT